MAISARTQPELIVSGVLTNLREIKASKGDNVGQVLGVNVMVETPGGKLQVTSWDRNPIPGKVESLLGSEVAFLVTVDENARGANLTFERIPTANDLESLARILDLATAAA